MKVIWVLLKRNGLIVLLLRRPCTAETLVVYSIFGWRLRYLGTCDDIETDHEHIKRYLVSISGKFGQVFSLLMKPMYS